MKKVSKEKAKNVKSEKNAKDAKNSKKKKNEIKDRFEKYAKEYPIIVLLSIEKMPCPLFVSIQKKLKAISCKTTMFKKSPLLHFLKCMNKENTKFTALEKFIRSINYQIVFIFVHNLDEVDYVYYLTDELRVKAFAQEGDIAPNDITIYRGTTLGEPKLTAFCQAINLLTKIEKATIKVINDTIVIHKGEKFRKTLVDFFTRFNMKQIESKFYLIGVFFGDQIVKYSDIMNARKSTINCLRIFQGLSIGCNQYNQLSAPFYISQSLVPIRNLLNELDLEGSTYSVPIPVVPRVEKIKKQPEEEMVYFGDIFDQKQ